MMCTYAHRRLILVCAGLLLWTSGVRAGSYEDFFKAVETDNPLVIQSLLGRGFDPNTVNPKGLPALLLAIKLSAGKVTKVLLEHPDIWVEVRSPEDESPLMLAAFTGNVELCEALIAKDADVNKTGWAPLHYAATNAHNPVVRVLLDNFAYVDAESPNGSTPLMMAAMYGSSSTVKLLLEAGADPTLKNTRGLSAMDFAREAKKNESMEIIGAFVRALRPKGVW